MQKITLNVKDDLFASLERDFKTFIRLSVKFDSQFVTPSFDRFLLARLADNATLLTEQAVQHLMLSGQYAWAKRALDKDFPDVVAILMNQAAEYGFNIAVRHDWTTDDLTKAAKAWATAIVKQAKGDEAQIDILATQIKAAAVSIATVEEKLRTPAWRIALSHAQQLHDVKIAMEHARGSVAREKLGELRCLLKLGIAYGSISKKEEQEIMENLRSRKPFLFMEEGSGGLARFFTWLRTVFAQQQS
ncbi:MAG TPA: DUF4088 family protein [Herbaspirillum sp.]|jgi:hypothetical protein